MGASVGGMQSKSFLVVSLNLGPVMNVICLNRHKTESDC